MANPTDNPDSIMDLAAATANDAADTTVNNEALPTSTSHSAPASQRIGTSGPLVPPTAPAFRPFPNGFDKTATDEYMKKMGATKNYQYCLCCGQASDLDHLTNFQHCTGTCWRCNQAHPGTICRTWDKASSRTWWCRHLGRGPRAVEEMQQPGQMLENIQFRETGAQNNSQTEIAQHYAQQAQQAQQAQHAMNAFCDTIMYDPGLNDSTTWRPMAYPAPHGFGSYWPNIQSSSQHRSRGRGRGRGHGRGRGRGQIQADRNLHHVRDARIDRRTNNQAPLWHAQMDGNDSNMPNLHSQDAQFGLQAYQQPWNELSAFQPPDLNSHTPTSFNGQGNHTARPDSSAVVLTHGIPGPLPAGDDSTHLEHTNKAVEK